MNGQSLVDVAGENITWTRQLGQVVDGVELVLWPSPEIAAAYGVTDAGDLAWMNERLTPHPWQCFEQPLKLTNEEALWAIPAYHIVCTATLATRDPDLMAKARAEGRLWDIDTGHDLMITEPAWVADALTAFKSGNADGISFMLGDTKLPDGSAVVSAYAALDLDHCRDPRTGSFIANPIS